MGAVDDILRRAKQLRRGDLSRLIKQLDAYLSSAGNGRGETGRVAQVHGSGRPQRRHSARAKKRVKISYAGWLAWSGKVHSGLSDVSSNKGKYLAEAYAPRRNT